MTERVAQRRLPSPTERLNFPLELCSGRHSALDGSTDISDFKVEMDRGPMSTVVANRAGSGRRWASSRLGHQVDLGRSTRHLGDRTIEEPSLDSKTERCRVELDSAFKVFHIDVDE